jgi:acyl-CoA thioesterase
VFGGHLLAELTVAAGRMDPAKVVKSTHGVFSRTVSGDEPADVDVEVLHSGRALTTVSATLHQRGTECARATVLLTSVEADLIRHGSEMPPVAGPEAGVTDVDGFGREVGIVGGIDRSDPAVVAPPELYFWVRMPGPIPDQLTAQALLAHATAGHLMGTHMLPHEGVGERMAHVSFSTGILAHTVSFHEPVDLTQWTLVAQHSTYTGRGRAYGTGQVFTEGGDLVASFSQEALMRPFPEGHSPEGRESTIL